jgi:protein-S-isoprenylcysteine O-methyltransferase Ste14
MHLAFSWIRIYLLCGLLFHKAVWEILKAREGGNTTAAKPRRTLGARFLSAVKIAILVGIMVQALTPDLLPLSSSGSTGLQALGLALYTLGLVTAVTGRIQLGWNWSDIEQAHLQQDHTLVSRGLYRYIRHPIYAGDLLLVLGFELALNSWCVLGILVLVVYIRRRAVREEFQLRQALPAYDHYCRHTARFLPFLPV